MKRASPILLLFLGALLLAVLLWRPIRAKLVAPRGERPVATDWAAGEAPLTRPSSAVFASPGRPPAPLLGETILREYGRTNLPPENDLTLMSRLMENALLLLKAAANRPLSANEDWADLLRGKNAAHEMFLPAQHIALNARGQLVDRWATPLFFHALGGGRFELRSAGPDRKLWTMDDIHRNADGSFRRGSALNPPALWDAAGARPTPGR